MTTGSNRQGWCNSSWECIVNRLIIAVLLLVLIGPSGLASSAAASVALDGGAGASHIIRLEIPGALSREAVVAADEQRAAFLWSHARGELAKRFASAESDLLVIWVDHDGTPILPDLEHARSHPRAASNGLSFTYNSSTYPWTPSEIATLQSYVSDFFPANLAMYGEPAFNITINVRKDPTITYAGLYFPSSNEMVMKDTASPDVFCHEMLHGFHDDIIVGFPTYEEGMVRAAEIAVFNQLVAYTHWDEHHQYDYDVLYDALNVPAIGATGGNIYVGPATTLARYQLAGYAWGKPQLELSSFFSDFNRDYYVAVMSDPSTSYTESKLTPILRGIAPKVEGRPFDAWYADQKVLSMQPPIGYMLDQRGTSVDIKGDYVYRDPGGSETAQVGASVYWEVRDHTDAVVSDGTAVTNSLGVMGPSGSVPFGYVGRVKITLDATSPQGPVRDVSYRSYGQSDGVFGIVTDANVGQVTLIRLDVGGEATVSLTNGCFEFPGLGEQAGRFAVVFRYNGGGIQQRIVTKDAGRYFVQFDTNHQVAVGDAPVPERMFIARPSVTRTGTRVQLGAALTTHGEALVFDVGGHRVRTIELARGTSEVVWNGADEQGTATPSGVYWIRVSAGDVRGVARVLIVR
jgi:hypothetical protein